MNFPKAIAKVAVSRLLPSRKVYVFSGLRRSGNHAIIGWVINGLENETTEYGPVGEQTWPWFNVSETGKTVFLNEVNMVSARNYLGALLKNRKYLRKAGQIIVSCEDTNLDYFSNWRIPKNYRHGVIIQRSLLNLLASRLKNLRELAKDGIGQFRQTINQSLLDSLLSLDKAPPDRFTKIRFDDWLIDSDYRKTILTELVMKGDILPGISKEGGGSSFSGRELIPDPSDLKRRFQHVEVPERILNLLRNPKYRSLMNQKEWSLIQVQTAAADRLKQLH